MPQAADYYVIKPDRRGVRTFTAVPDAVDYSDARKTGSQAISKEDTFTDCVVLARDAFDPDAVFLDDIVDDNVLPRLSLAVDGLTERRDAKRGGLELRHDDVAANAPVLPSTTMPDASLDPEELEVYGWESSLWRKICGYLGF